MSIDKKEFKNPSAEYRGIPFWSWNCKVTKELIDKQLDYFKEMGFGGVDIHPRVGLDNVYLGDEYMELIKFTAEKCKEKNLVCWLYDDDRFPSGAADGYVTKNMEYRDRGLLLTVKKKENYLNSRNEFERAVKNGERPKGYFLCAYSLEFNDGFLRDYKYLKGQDEIDEEIRLGNKIRYAYVKIADEISAFEGQTYVDTLNPKAIDEFIRITHERYNDVVGGEFGNTVQAIFTDEPRIGKQTQISDAMSDENFEIPYSECFEEFIKENYGFDMLKAVPELVWDLPNGGSSKSRYIYRNALTECFALSYMDNICNWCKDHNILMTGHVLSETPLIHQSATVGECMRSYRNMDIPGVDVLCDDHCFVAVKQAVSVSKQLGRKGTMSELYGVTNWDCTFKTYKLQGDWQAALGITTRVPHLSFMSMAGEGKRDWPASIFYQSPWYKEFIYIEDYFSRVNYVLSKGKPVTRVGIIHPIESIWLHLGQKDKNEEGVKKIQSDFAKIMDTLLFGTIDADYISESLLPEQCGEIGSKLNVGKMAYDTIVIPSMKTIRKTTLDILEKFKAQGGRVIFAGEVPGMTDAEVSDRASRLAECCELTTPDLLVSIMGKERDIKITYNDIPSDNLFYQLRQDGDDKYLFVCNVMHTNNEKRHYKIQIKGQYSAEKYNAVTGETEKINSETDGNYTYIFADLYSEDSVLLKLTKANDSIEKNINENKEILPVEVIASPSDISEAEKNMLLLDYARYSIDNGEESDRTEILKTDDEIRNILGFTKRSDRMFQPWATDEKEYHKLSLSYDIYSETEVYTELGMELPPECKIYLNDKSVNIDVTGYYVDEAVSVIRLPKLEKGLNRLKVEMEYNQKTNIENMYLLGTFDVELNGEKAVLKEKSSRREFGDIRNQGMPFYTGNIDYTVEFTAENDGWYYIRIPEFNAPVIAVYSDNGTKNIIAYQPHRTSLGYLKKGKHSAVIRLYGNRFNGFGMLHNTDTELKWPGPKSYRTTGKEWTDSYMTRPVGIMSDVIIEYSPQ